VVSPLVSSGVSHSYAHSVLANDVAAGSRGIVRVRQTLAGAFGMLITTLHQRAATLDAKRRRLYHRIKEGSDDPQNMSILSSIMGVTQTVSLIALLFCNR
jgi:non-canonical poly(A) RNA polymerase PAPD5/7